MIDSHIHFEKQPYTLETVKEMVTVAMKNNIDEIWLIDHTHKFKEFEIMYSPLKQFPQYEKIFFSKKRISIQEYIDFVEIIKKENFPVKIKFGLEVCYFPESKKVTEKLLRKYPFEILIGSVHHVFGMPYDLEDEYWDYFNVDDIYHEYYKCNMLAVESKLFTHLAHPDAIKRFNKFPSYDLTNEYEALAKVLNEYNLPTENNSGFVRYGFTELGMNKHLKTILKNHGVKILLSSDAHEAKYIGYGFYDLL